MKKYSQDSKILTAVFTVISPIWVFPTIMPFQMVMFTLTSTADTEVESPGPFPSTCSI